MFLVIIQVKHLKIVTLFEKMISLLFIDRKFESDRAPFQGDIHTLFVLSMSKLPNFS
ncbi:hypothetical protein [Kamptonema sp. UHCC 0994]|uniref:hypothetical protein n=1 Tax=Kamptonema sp. UHCC 0994 TaxID=3031329 RepID=UPI0023BA315F|nr:hypothetical protein [Kamptonema sp. UHCC 0994]MDF0552456.1 hypothetical protein [Kamptonema sp. UHCC 0994]